MSTDPAAFDHLVEQARLRHRTAEEVVAFAVREAIVSGLFEPGERLTQERLAGLLGVSRMPIRSALRQLESEGLVEQHAHKGASVRALASDELADLYEMRILIETYALRKTVAAATPRDMSDLAILADRLDALDGRDDAAASRTEFYRGLYSVGNTPRVVSTIMQFRGEVNRYAVGLRATPTHAHRSLLNLISEGDGAAAAQWLERHLRGVLAQLQEVLRQLGASPAT